MGNLRTATTNDNSYTITRYLHSLRFAENPAFDQKKRNAVGVNPALHPHFFTVTAASVRQIFANRNESPFCNCYHLADNVKLSYYFLSQFLDILALKSNL